MSHKRVNIMSNLCNSAAVLTACFILAGCAMVGPDYQRPQWTMAAYYQTPKGWVKATPQAGANKGPWWTRFKDPKLDTLIEKVQVNNQNVAQYAARYRQARALAKQAGAQLAPEVDLSASQSRSRSQARIGNSQSLTSSLSWELDLWGKLRRQRQQQIANAQASQADLANATLSAQSQVAQNYFQLRVMDAQIDIYRQNIEIYQRYLQVVDNQYQSGKETRSALAQAKTQLYRARSSLLDLKWQRAQLVHAIAVLIGESPATFHLAKREHFRYFLPVVAPTIPSALLQRRPDIASAERQLAAANASVGVAIAGYFPDLTLSAQGGFSSDQWHNLLEWPSRMWSIGPKISWSLLDFGRTRAKVAQAKASYQEQVASYRQTVLDALKEVEDYLVQGDILQQEIQVQRKASAAAQESAQISYNQYRSGMIDYLDVASTAQTSLSEQQNVLSLIQKQLVARVKLLVALGGDWQKKSSSAKSLHRSKAMKGVLTKP